jgi:protein-tyrosine phosphatase
VSLSKTIRICFVCLGNIVRSPLAENLFRHLAEQVGGEHKYEIDSAGTSAWHVGEPPDPRMQRIAARQGLVCDGRARQFQRADFDRFDLIIAMDAENREALQRLAPHEEARDKIRMLREFDPQGRPDAPVPDPYYGETSGFEEVFEIVERSVRGLLQALEAGEVVKK